MDSFNVSLECCWVGIILAALGANVRKFPGLSRFSVLLLGTGLQMLGKAFFILEPSEAVRAGMPKLLRIPGTHHQLNFLLENAELSSVLLAVEGQQLLVLLYWLLCPVVNFALILKCKKVEFIKVFSGSS